MSLLHIAVAKGNLTEVKYLIETQGYSPDNSGFFDWFLMTPLAVAAKKNQPEIADYLIEKGANLEARGEFGYGSTPMEIALEHKYIPVVASLLAANVQIPHFHYSSDTLNNSEKTEIVTEYLVKAASANDTASIEKILKNEYANVDGTHYDTNADIKFMSPLEAAAKGNHFEATALLIEKGAFISSCSPFTWKKHPLNLATDTQLIELLIEHTPEVSRCLFGAIVSGKEELITLLVKNGANIEYSLQCGDFSFSILTPLEFAIMKDDSTMIKSLVENGAHISAESIFHASGTPLELAAEYGKIQALDTLIQLGSDLAHQNANGQTALDLALKAGHSNAVNMLTLHSVELSNEAIVNKSDELNSDEMEPILTSEQIMTPIVDDPYLQNSRNTTISDNVEFLENFSQPTNGTLLISIELNEVLMNEQMILLANQEVQAIELKIDNNYTMPDTQAETLYIPSMNIPLGSIEHQQLLLG